MQGHRRLARFVILAAFLLLAATAEGRFPASLPPATPAAIRTAGKACIGATVDPAGQDARLAGWVDATPAQKGTIKTDGRVVTRDNVLLIVKAGTEGGCVVMATTDPKLDKTAYYADLGKDLGVTIVTDPAKPVTELGNGEILVTVLTPEGDKLRAMLIFANAKAQFMKHKGN